MFFSVIMMLLISAGLKDPLTNKERKFATDYLKKTEIALRSSIKGLSEAQLKYKPAPDRWSIEDCVKHIAVSEMGLWQMTDSVINKTANPEKRAEIKVSDEEIIKMIADRSSKAQAAEPLQPQNTSFTSHVDALESIKQSRQKLISYVKSTGNDLRNHVLELPFGHFDSYQMILFIGGHAERHTAQINEVKADPGFPKN